VTYFAYGSKKLYAQSLLSQFQALGNVSVAGSIVFTQKDEDLHVIITRQEYRLISARAESLPHDDFNDFSWKLLSK